VLFTEDVTKLVLTRPPGKGAIGLAACSCSGSGGFSLWSAPHSGQPYLWRFIPMDTSIPRVNSSTAPNTLGHDIVIHITALPHIFSILCTFTQHNSARALWPIRVKLRVSPGQYPSSRALLPSCSARDIIAWPERVLDRGVMCQTIFLCLRRSHWPRDMHASRPSCNVG
jgi:hypothetical protein